MHLKILKVPIIILNSHNSWTLIKYSSGFSWKNLILTKNASKKVCITHIKCVDKAILCSNPLSFMQITVICYTLHNFPHAVTSLKTITKNS